MPRPRRQQPIVYQFNPENLRTLCLDVITLNLNTISSVIEQRDLRELHKNVSLPVELSEAIISTYTDNGLLLTDTVLHAFRNTNKTRLNCVDLSNSLISDWGLQWISCHPLSRIDISGCNELSSQAVDQIKKLAPGLKVLILGNKGKLFAKSQEQSLPSYNTDMLEQAQPSEQVLKAPNLKVLSVSDLKTDEMKVFLDKVIEQGPHSLFLKVLDLSDCKLEFPAFCWISNLPTLEILVLFNVLTSTFDLNDYLPYIGQLKMLKHLDVSMKRDERLSLQYPSARSQQEALRHLLIKLPRLNSLDISGTHLAGVEPEPNHRRGCTDTLSDSYHPIPGLAGRQFEFLGLLDCVDQACNRRNIPAKRVTGVHTIAQVLESLKVYERRKAFCNIIQSRLYNMLKEDSNCVKDKATCLKLVCNIMRRHMNDLERQISGSAAMFYLIKTPDYRLHQFASSRLIRCTVRTLYDAMDGHFNDKSMLRNGLLTMCHFSIPEDLLFIYKDVVGLLLQTIRQCHPVEDEFLQRISIYILNSLVCRVDNHEKLLVGDEGAVRTMLWLIKNKLEHQEPDEILEMAWSTLWNITDETSKNCARFLEGEGEREGLKLFMQCYYRFCEQTTPSSSDEEQPNNQSKEALLRNMMGLLGNVAEVDSLRRRFLKPRYIKLFRKLLLSKSDGIEVSYNAAGILCHIASDGTNLREWALCDLSSDLSSSDSSDSSDSDICMMDSVCSIDEGGTMGVSMSAVGAASGHVGGATSAAAESSSSVSDYCSWEVSVVDDLARSGCGSRARSQVMADLVEAIGRWDLKAQRSINYRSFKPILKLLQCTHTVEVRHWSVWALCNLTTVYADKYCPLLKKEGGIPILINLSNNQSGQETQAVIQLSKMTLKNCDDFFRGSTQPTYEVSELT